MKASLYAILYLTCFSFLSLNYALAESTCKDILELKVTNLVDFIPSFAFDVLESGEGFVIYKSKVERPGSKTRILFDSRFAETAIINLFPNNSPTKTASINSDTGRIFIHEGRHRALTASRGHRIPRKLGGGPARFLLNYEYVINSPTTNDIRHGISRLIDIDNEELEAFISGAWLRSYYRKPQQ